LPTSHTAIGCEGDNLSWCRRAEATTLLPSIGGSPRARLPVGGTRQQRPRRNGDSAMPRTPRGRTTSTFLQRFSMVSESRRPQSPTGELVRGPRDHFVEKKIAVPITTINKPTKKVDIRNIVGSSLNANIPNLTGPSLLVRFENRYKASPQPRGLKAVIVATIRPQTAMKRNHPDIFQGYPVPDIQEPKPTISDWRISPWRIIHGRRFEDLQNDSLD